MDNLDAARLQMAFTLIFHIIFACIGMVMPFFMVVSHKKWLNTRNPIYLKLTKSWQKGVAIFFVVGAVSGTALSFELGLLWPEFMKHAGPIIGMPFSLEGAAFFVEAVALGFYLYGWGRISEKFHWFTGIIVGLSGVASGILVVSANGWMNAPSGFDYINGEFTNIDPIKALQYGPLSIEAFTPGKIFKANNGILFFDEINRCSEKLQNALLQVLAEKRVTIGSYDLDLFLGSFCKQL